MKYLSLNAYAKENFQMKLYRLSLDGGFTCPNRDGLLGTNGCIFCDGHGAGSFSGGRTISIKEQLQNQKELISGKLPKGPVGYIAYFQAFTNTYAPVERLKSLYLEAVEDPEVKVLSIATRPDCLSKEVLLLLKEVNEIIPVWVELGLQTSKTESVSYIRRGYENEVYEKAVKDLKEIGISQIITHVILFLPGETEEDMLNTIRFSLESGTTGLKLQLLHVLKCTDLEKDYLLGKFSLPDMEEYIQMVKKCLSIIPEDIVIHRLTGDGDKRNLVAPLWSADKKRVLNAMKKELDCEI